MGGNLGSWRGCSPATLLALITPAARCQKESSAATQDVLQGLPEGGEKLPPPFKLCLLLHGEPKKSKGTCLYVAKILYL